MPEEMLLARYQLQDLCDEAAKLKTLGAMEAIPSERLVRLLNVLEKNIRAAEKMSLISDPVSIFLLFYTAPPRKLPLYFIYFRTCNYFAIKIYMNKIFFMGRYQCWIFQSREFRLIFKLTVGNRNNTE